MKQLTNKEYAVYEQCKADQLHSRSLTLDGLRVFCADLDNDPEESGIHMLEILAKSKNEGVVD